MTRVRASTTSARRPSCTEGLGHDLAGEALADRAHRVEGAGGQLFEGVDRGAEGAQLRDQLLQVGEQATARGPLGQELLHDLLVQRLQVLDPVFVLALPGGREMRRLQQEVGDLGQGRGHHHRLFGLVLLDQPGHAPEAVVGPDGSGVELHHDHEQCPLAGDA